MNHFIKTTLRDYLNENSSEDIYKYSKRVIYDHINNFLEKTYYSNVKYRDLINSCDLSKGNCMDVSEELYLYFVKLGYKKIELIDLYEPKFNMNKAHHEYLNDNNIIHEVLKIGIYYVDLTGSQFSDEQSGIKIYTKTELSKMWGKFEKLIYKNKYEMLPQESDYTDDELVKKTFEAEFGDNTTTIRQRLDFANELAIETGLSKDFILGIIKNRN